MKEDVVVITRYYLHHQQVNIKTTNTNNALSTMKVREVRTGTCDFGVNQKNSGWMVVYDDG